MPQALLAGVGSSLRRTVPGTSRRGGSRPLGPLEASQVPIVANSAWRPVMANRAVLTTGEPQTLGWEKVRTEPADPMTDLQAGEGGGGMTEGLALGAGSRWVAGGGYCSIVGCGRCLAVLGSTQCGSLVTLTSLSLRPIVKGSFPVRGPHHSRPVWRVQAAGLPPLFSQKRLFRVVRAPTCL